MTTTSIQPERLDTDHLREVAEHHGDEELRQIADALDVLRPLHERGIKAPHRYMKELKTAGFWAQCEKYGAQDLLTRFCRDPEAPGCYNNARILAICHVDGPSLVPVLEDYAARHVRYLERDSHAAEHLPRYASTLFRILRQERERVERAVTARSVREAKWEALERLTAAVQGAVEAMGKEAVR